MSHSSLFVATSQIQNTTNLLIILHFYSIKGAILQGTASKKDNHHHKSTMGAEITSIAADALFYDIIKAAHTHPRQNDHKQHTNIHQHPSKQRKKTKTTSKANKLLKYTTRKKKKI